MISKLLSVSIVILGVYLITLPNGVVGVKCYSCDSAKNSTCSDPFNATSTLTVNCTQTDTCVKIHYHSASHADETFRGCASKNSESCESYESTFNTTHDKYSNYKCYSCSKDGCNSAVTIMVPLVAIVAALFATRMT